MPDERTHARTPRRIWRAARCGMTDSRSADIPIAIDRVDCRRSDRDGVDLRLTGRWLNGAEQTGTDPLLVVQVQGRRHRFAAEGDTHPLPAGAW